MATGIVSLASDVLGYGAVARALFGLNLGAYGVLATIYLCRLACSPQLLVRDLGSDKNGPGSLTIVAATTLIGTQLHLFTGWQGVALAFWFVAIGLWAVLLYGFLLATSLRAAVTADDSRIDGSWLLLTVATEAIAVQGSYFAPALPRPGIAEFACFAFYGAGAVLYLIVIPLVFRRWIVVGLRSDAFSPNFWIASGALSITTLAGSRLVQMHGPLGRMLAPLVDGLDLLFWATATWWLPLLLVTEIWRHAVRRVPLHYDPAWWSMVFPIGMYVAATHAFARAADLVFLDAIAEVGIHAAWAAWLAVAAGLVRALARMRGAIGAAA